MCVINFEVTQPTTTVCQRNRQTDGGRTDRHTYNISVTVLRFARRASRGKKYDLPVISGMPVLLVSSKRNRVYRLCPMQCTQIFYSLF